MATTTNYSWTTPDNTAYVKDGASAIRTLGSSVDTTLFTALGGAYPGLRLVKKQTIGTAVSSVNVTNAFSATYENYLILVSGGVASTTADFGFSLDGITSGYNSNLVNQTWGVASVSGAVSSGASLIWVGGSSTNSAYMNLMIMGPQAARHKRADSKNFGMTTGGSVGTSSHLITSTTQATGFTITTSPGTITGGTIYVYGFGIS